MLKNRLFFLGVLALGAQLACGKAKEEPGDASIGNDADERGPDASGRDAGDGGVSRDACFSACTGTWKLLPNDRPVFDTPRAVAVYDPVGKRAIVTGAPSTIVWQLPFEGANANRFSMVTTSDGQTPPFLDSGTYDSRRQRLIVRSKDARHRNPGIYALDLATSAWRPVTSTRTPSAGELFHDPTTDTYVIVGLDPSERLQVWTSSATEPLAWRLLDVPNAPGLAGTAITLDTRRARVMAIDAQSGTTVVLPLSPLGRWGVLPQLSGARTLGTYSGVYDSAGDRYVVFRDLSEVWALPLSGTGNWTRLSGAAIPGRTAETVVYDSDRGQLVVLGGISGTSVMTFGQQGLYNDVWAFSLGATPGWTNLLPNERRPFTTGGPNVLASYDSTRNAVLYLPPADGYPDDWTRQSFEAWWLYLDPVHWEQITLGGGPTGTFGHLFYQPSRDRYVMLRSVLRNPPVAGEAWALDLLMTAWKTLTLNGVPPASLSKGVFLSDPDRALFLGRSRTNAQETALFQLGLDDELTWSDVPTKDPPPFRARDITLAPDFNVLIASGQIGGTWALYLNENPPRWVELRHTSPAFTSPAAYEPRRRAVVASGGNLLPLDCSADRATLESKPPAPNTWHRLVSTPSGVVSFTDVPWLLSIDSCR